MSRVLSAGQFSTTSNGLKEVIPDSAYSIIIKHLSRGILKRACSNSWIGLSRKGVRFWQEQVRRAGMQVRFLDDGEASPEFDNR